jgi:predicted XRE-type DNA-binding protein
MSSGSFLIASGMKQQEIVNKLHVSQSCISRVRQGLKTSLKA